MSLASIQERVGEVVRRLLENRGAVALSGIAALILWTIKDFLSWRSFGTGGTPPTFQGYIKIRKFGLRRLLARDDLRDPSPLSDEGPRYLEIAIPPREGGHPNLTHWTLPQRQHPEAISPKAHERLSNLMQKFAADYPEILDYGPSKTEGGTGHAIYAKPELPMTNPVAKKIRCEIAHVHPSENSLHVHISPRDAREIITAGWGMRFSVQGLAPPSWIMVYAPRDESEVDIIERIVRAAVGWNTGVKI